MSSPLPVYAPPSATSADLRLILHALDSCLATFSRYSAILDATQRRVEARIKETRAFARVALEARTTRRPEVVSPPATDTFVVITNPAPPGVVIQLDGHDATRLAMT